MLAHINGCGSFIRDNFEIIVRDVPVVSIKNVLQSLEVEYSDTSVEFTTLINIFNRSNTNLFNPPSFWLGQTSIT